MNTALNELFAVVGGLLRACLGLVGAVATALETKSEDDPYDGYPADLTYNGDPAMGIKRAQQPQDNYYG